MNHHPAHPQRVFAHQRILRLTQDVFQHGARMLAEAATDRIGNITAVVGIANGGLTPAATIAHALRTPTYQVTAKHNTTDDPYHQATGTVSHDLHPLVVRLRGRRLHGNVLLVDDISGSGATFTTLLPALAPHLAATCTVHTAALCRNTGSDHNPRLWLWDVNDWVRFPWEHPIPHGHPIEDLTLPHRVQPA
ncbi:phosphoribosyltransferase family protein [Solwaraspora sp. WMMD1047]|uniref:phosphoribosyltransferase n=1 Tax=Solwaraspora sp. WMMD1047 TaxID=3016102 RepID=UPI0024170BD9|nr:phosphoribosyltransferase family protein [Solwaraspora sp. WMMD1047]MDG4830012.1 phosphoribosyltransferase family protein [Solwaraspora sp. WMMD1047]